MALLGIGVVAVPTGIISSGFVEQITIENNEKLELEKEPSYIKELKMLKKLKEKGVITEEEFNLKKKQLLKI